MWNKLELLKNKKERLLLPDKIGGETYLSSNFTTLFLLCIILLSPIYSQTLDEENPVISWDPIPNASSYQLQIRNEAVVKSIMPYGAFVEFLPGKQGLLHISEISHKRIENMDGILKEGDTIKVKLLEVDPKTGKFKLSHKVLLPKE